MSRTARFLAWWRAQPVWLRDAPLGVVLALAGLVALGFSWGIADPQYRQPDAFAVLLTLVGTLPLALRRIAPLRVLVIVAAAVVLALVLDFPDTTNGISVLVATYTVAGWADRRRALLGAGVVFVGLIAL